MSCPLSTRAFGSAKLKFEIQINPTQSAKISSNNLQESNIRIDGVGLQAHFIVGETPTIDDQISNLDLYSALNVETAYTELDIRLAEPENSTNLAQQSTDYETTVGACMQVKTCIGITVWDFWDPVSWVGPVFAGFGSADLWFANFTKHPAYYGVVDAIKNGTKAPTGPHWRLT